MAKKPDYHPLVAAIQWIQHEGNRARCIRLFEDHEVIFRIAPGSKSKHQDWPGGYLHHLEETMNIALLLYREMKKTKRDVPFFLGDAILVLFLHDLEKPWKYGGDEDAARELKIYGGNNLEFVLAKAKQYEFELTSDHVNALQFVHGEGEAYDPYNRLQRPLAAFVHICDVTSARIWYNYPKMPGGNW